MTKYNRSPRRATVDAKRPYLTLIRTADQSSARSEGGRIADEHVDTSHSDSASFRLAQTDVQHVLNRVVFTLRNTYGTGDDGVYFVLSVLDSTFGWSGRFGAEWMAAARKHAELSRGVA